MSTLRAFMLSLLMVAIIIVIVVPTAIAISSISGFFVQLSMAVLVAIGFAAFIIVVGGRLGLNVELFPELFSMNIGKFTLSTTGRKPRKSHMRALGVSQF